MTTIDRLTTEFEVAAQAWRERAIPLAKEAEDAAIRLIAAHALSVASDTVYMLIESSDQGHYMCVPSYLTDEAGAHLAEEEWDQRSQDDDDLMSAAGWLGWDGPWERFADLEHTFTNPRSGYYALDMRRIVAEFPQIKEQ
jgi:hypothetical protein